MMKKYTYLWEWVSNQTADMFVLTYEEIEKIAGVPLDHSFLNEKKDLLPYGYQVKKISMKEKTVTFHKTETSR